LEEERVVETSLSKESSENAIHSTKQERKKEFNDAK